MLVAVIAALAGVERCAALRYIPSPLLRRFALTDLLFFATGGVALSLAMRSTATRSAGLLALAPAELSPAVAMIMALVIYDLGAYLSHYLLHRIDALWEIHKVHHSSLTLDWLATFRAHTIEHALRHFLGPVALILLGFSPVTVATVGALHVAWAVFCHANFAPHLRLLEPVLITPRLHRLHHVPATSTRNLGTFFSFWDRMRGRLETDPGAALEPIGVPEEAGTYPQTFMALLVEPLGRIVTRDDQLACRRFPAAPTSRTTCRNDATIGDVSFRA